jgi:hypothetical protein
VKIRNGTSKTSYEIDNRNQLKNSLSPLSHFTEHLMGVFRKLPLKSDLNYKISSLLIQRLKNYTDFSLLQSIPHHEPIESHNHKIEEYGLNMYW